MTFQTVFGTGVMALTLAGVLNVLGVVTEKSSYIEVHSISLEVVNGAPYVSQKRTVQVNGLALTARWEATVHPIVGARLGDPICRGDGGWDYVEGYKAALLPFDDWVGDSGCFDRIPDGTKVKLHATYKWGVEDPHEKWSDQIVVDKSIFN